MQRHNGQASAVLRHREQSLRSGQTASPGALGGTDPRLETARPGLAESGTESVRRIRKSCLIDATSLLTTTAIDRLAIEHAASGTTAQ